MYVYAHVLEYSKLKLMFLGLVILIKLVLVCDSDACRNHQYLLLSVNARRLLADFGFPPQLLICLNGGGASSFLWKHNFNKM